MIEGRPNSPAVVAGVRTLQQQQHQARQARRLPPPLQQQGAVVCARRPVSDCRDLRDESVFSTAAGAARVLYTDAGAPPALEARGGAGDACGRRGIGHAICRLSPGADKDGMRCIGWRRERHEISVNEGKGGAGQAHRIAKAGTLAGQ